jgi:phosphotransferase system enzyme I (PtsI)
MTEAKKQVVLMKGIGVSSGIVIGQAYIMERGIIEPSQYCYLEASETEKEIERFEQAVQLSRDQLLRIKKKMEKDGRGKEHILIIDAHLMILQDNMLINDTIKVIKKERVNAEWAIKSVLKDIKEYFDKMDDSYLRERSMDIEHIVNRVLLNLMGARVRGRPQDACHSHSPRPDARGHRSDGQGHRSGLSHRCGRPHLPHLHHGALSGDTRHRRP